jgi:hypothetical protein
VPRADEVREILRDLEQQDIALDVMADDGVTQAQVLARYQTFAAQFTEYIDWRDDQLDDGLEIIGQAYSSSATGDSLDDDWSEFFLARGREASDRLNRLADGLDNHVPQLKARARAIASEEAQFFAQLAAAPLARAAGELAWQHRDLDVECARLEDKWEQLGDQDEDIDEKIEATTNDILKLLEEVVEKLVTEQRGLIAKVEAVRIDPSQPVTGGVGNALGLIAKGVATVVFSETEKLKATTAAYLQTLTGLHQMQEGVTVLFTTMRDDVRKYLEQRRLATANETFDDATSAARDLAGKCPTAGQRDDAVRFIERVVDEVEPIIDAFELSYKRFVDVHREVFVGPVGPAAIERLIEPDARERGLEQIEDFDLEDRLQQLVDTSAPTIFVDVEGLSDADKEEIRSVFMVEWKKLGEGLVAAKNDHLTDRVVTTGREFVSKLTGKLKDSKGGEQ